MRQYSKPELNTELFDVSSTIGTAVVSVPVFEEDQGGMDWAPAPDLFEYVNDLTVENPSGAFRQEVSGGNPIQEALNTLYENFLNKF